MPNSTLSDYLIYISKSVDWAEPAPGLIGGIRSRALTGAEIQTPWTDRSLPSVALDTRFPAGMTSLFISDKELMRSRNPDCMDSSKLPSMALDTRFPAGMTWVFGLAEPSFIIRKKLG